MLRSFPETPTRPALRTEPERRVADAFPQGPGDGPHASRPVRSSYPPRNRIGGTDMGHVAFSVLALMAVIAITTIGGHPF